MDEKLSHYDSAGAVSMVDVSRKSGTVRTAKARAYVALSQNVIASLPSNKKGDPFEVARIAAIMAAKKTSELIPLCHPMTLTNVAVHLTLDSGGVEIIVTASTIGPTGVEMEAMTAACVAALTVYDMTKALDKGIEILSVHLLEKTGGKSGTYRREEGI